MLNIVLIVLVAILISFPPFVTSTIREDMTFPVGTKLCFSPPQAKRFVVTSRPDKNKQQKITIQAPPAGDILKTARFEKHPFLKRHFKVTVESEKESYTVVKCAE